MGPQDVMGVNIGGIRIVWGQEKIAREKCSSDQRGLWASAIVGVQGEMESWLPGEEGQRGSPVLGFSLV